jgi:hypothetical protein
VTDLDVSVSSFTAQLPNFERDELGAVLGVTLLECLLVRGDLVDDGLRRVGWNRE